MAEESTVTLAFPVRLTNGITRGLPLAYIEHSSLGGISTYANSIAKAKPKLREALSKAVDAALLQVQNYQQVLLGCEDGTVLLVQFCYGTWGYDIAGPGRKHFSGVTGHESLEVAIKAARRHAADSYGAVQWEVRR